MYYSETYKTPMHRYNVLRYFGIDPETQPEIAALAHVHPVTTLAPDGYAVSHYRKEADGNYTEVPHCITEQERKLVEILRASGSPTVAELRTSYSAPADPEVPQVVEGYFPCYTNELDAKLVSSTYTCHTHELGGVTYYMPDDGPDVYHGNYTDSLTAGDPVGLEPADPPLPDPTEPAGYVYQY